MTLDVVPVLLVKSLVLLIWFDMIHGAGYMLHVILKYQGKTTTEFQSSPQILQTKQLRTWDWNVHHVIHHDVLFRIQWEWRWRSIHISHGHDYTTEASWTIAALQLPYPHAMCHIFVTTSRFNDSSYRVSPAILLNTVSLKFLNVKLCGDVGALAGDGCTQSHWISKTIHYFKQSQSNWRFYEIWFVSSEEVFVSCKNHSLIVYSSLSSSGFAVALILYHICGVPCFKKHQVLILRAEKGKSE